MKTAFVYTDKYFAYDYGLSHPLKIERLRLTFELCSAYGLFRLPGAELIETVAATEAQILRFHTPAYVDALKRASRGEIRSNPAYGLGAGDNPVFPGLWQWSQLHAGASLQCADFVSSGVSSGEAKIAFNIAGGLHHAGPQRAFGFCYVNDPVLAVDYLSSQGKRVIYIDIDAHHGDGVQWAFYENPSVLTVSFHQDGRTLFPGTGAISETGQGPGEGYAVNVPMRPGTDDEVFWRGFEALVPPLMAAFKPQVVVAQLGVDSFWSDPLAALELTTNGFSKAVSYLYQIGIPWVALGGGGYDVVNVARAWTLAWAIMNGVDLPDELPGPMVEPLSRAGGRRVESLRDPVHKSLWHDKCLRHMEECIRDVEKRILPKIGSG